MTDGRKKGIVSFLLLFRVLAVHFAALTSKLLSVIAWRSVEKVGLLDGFVETLEIVSRRFDSGQCRLRIHHRSHARLASRRHTVCVSLSMCVVNYESGLAFASGLLLRCGRRQSVRGFELHE